MADSLTTFAHEPFKLITQPGQPPAGRPDRPPNWGLHPQLFRGTQRQFSGKYLFGSRFEN